MAKAGKELYVGSLSYDVTEYDLEKLFSVSGKVTSVHLITDSQTGQFKGCGYVRMSTEAEAKDAIASLDGAMLIDRQITVSIANPQKMKPEGGGLKGRWLGRSKGEPVAQSTGAKPAAAKPAGKTAAKPGAAKPAAARPAAKPAAKPAAAAAGAARPASARSDAPKAGFSKPAASRSGAPKPAAARAGASRQGGAKSGPGRGGKR